ncbi:hypothetical protein NDU88_004649 [Pleurodeles waltl]|uniref:Uncharacterized protein n=1 Tax=Pleurodeles waltl TaxID=8319 RepID=A0AAV7WSK2_PLEWA|nr:hypothetical protein NDU88_004649 [Pleurodeles waltl]
MGRSARSQYKDIHRRRDESFAAEVFRNSPFPLSKGAAGRLKPVRDECHRSQSAVGGAAGNTQEGLGKCVKMPKVLPCGLDAVRGQIRRGLAGPAPAQPRVPHPLLGSTQLDEDRAYSGGLQPRALATEGNLGVRYSLSDGRCSIIGVQSRDKTCLTS